jgi:hypothetical protein
LGIVIGTNIKKTDDSEQSILMRIMTNYLQIISAAFSFNISYPNLITDLFKPVEKIGSPSEVFLFFE